MSLNYSNFVIRLRDWNGNNGHFNVEVVNSPVGRMRSPKTSRFDRRILPFLERLEKPGGEDRLTREDVITLGDMLGDMLFPGSVRRMLHKSLSFVREQGARDRGLRILLEVDHPALNIVPWEFVYLWENVDMYGRRQTRKKIEALKEAKEDAKSGRARRKIINRILEKMIVHSLFEVQRNPKRLIPEADKADMERMIDEREGIGEQEKEKLLRKARAIKEVKEREDALRKLKNRLTDEEKKWAKRRLPQTRAEALADIEKNEPMSGFLASDPLISIVRHESFVTMPRKEKAVDELNVFVGMAEPRDKRLEDLALENEFTAIELAFEGNDAFNLVGSSLHLNPAMLNGVMNPRDRSGIIKRLLDFGRSSDKENVHIFHFSGHGGFFREDFVLDGEQAGKHVVGGQQASNGEADPITRTDEDAGHDAVSGPGAARRSVTRKGALVLERADDDDRPYLLWSDDLADTIKQGGVRLVVLGACQSARRDPTSFGFTGVAPALMKANIPAVVAMQYVISDPTAILFSTKFYEALAAGLSLDEAVAFGRREMMKLPDDERDQDWGVPVLYLRHEDGNIFPNLGKKRGLAALERNRYLKELYGAESEEFKELKASIIPIILGVIILILLGFVLYFALR